MADLLIKSARPGFMRRWIIRAGATTLDGLIREEAPIPTPGPGEVRVKVHAVSINYRDQIILTGEYGQTLTADTVPLSDGAGEIDAVGPGVGQWAVGDHVTSLYMQGWADGPPIPGLGFGLGSNEHGGMLAEYVILKADRVAAAPKSLSLLEAATLPCAALTAWTALNGDRPYAKRVGQGDQVLVLGTGGVSLFALLLAQAAGAAVTGTSSQAAKLDRLRSIGAVDAVNYRETPNWGEVVFAHTGGVKRVVNSAGGSSMDQAIAAVGYGGEIAFMGLFDQAATPPPLLILMMKGATIRGTAVGSAAAYRDLINAIDAAGIKPPIDRVFSFDEAKEAYQAAVSPELFGKIVISIVE